MTGSLREAWEFLSADLWEPLADFSTVEVAAPSDLFGDLYVTASDHLALTLTDAELEAARNEPAQAREYFLTIIGTHFISEFDISEFDIVEFLEEAHDVIADYEIQGYVDLYRRLVGRVLRKYNLRYRLHDPFTLRFLLPGSFNNLYAELERLNAGNGHLASLLTDFERAFDLYARSRDSSDLKTCIAKASN